ncbi:hypothetical protein SAMN04515671_3396 [Nakamurella panacisegetis]|uniref:Uncharacterized protein n=1 Tax=Nakamurella panacisegetis TaxID=1090615 RepID=A0A1H0R4W0_9ACTN|nr:hypothetical protein [Nakamurella panacisegetis]SDP24507.1 hypothetical protein SAMN04515671_3396 [Nakamurella panacisegetis]
MNWFAYVLIIIGGFLLGGVLSLWRNGSRVASVILAVMAAMCVAGGILWLV